MTRFMSTTFIICLLASLQCAQDPRTWIDAHIRINQIQTLGSHNSYKQAIDPSLMKILSIADSATARSLDYAHLPLAKQLDLGMRKLVQAGYMVRTRSDSGTREARSNDTQRFLAALQSGAQVISTDYYLPDPALGTGFQVRLPEGAVARLNPISWVGNRKLNALE